MSFTTITFSFWITLRRHFSGILATNFVEDSSIQTRRSSKRIVVNLTRVDDDLMHFNRLSRPVKHVLLVAIESFDVILRLEKYHLDTRTHEGSQRGRSREVIVFTCCAMSFAM